MTVQLDTTPYWADQTHQPKFPKLQRDEAVDVVVIGGGIMGLTAAYLLLGAGKSVAVLDRRRIGGGETGHTSAHLTMITDLPMTDLARQFGRDHAQAIWDAGLAAIAQIDAIVRAERIACDFAWVPGYLHAAPGQRGADVPWLQDEARVAAEMGFDATFVDDVPLMNVPGVRFHDQARFHPAKYAAGLAQAIVRKGGRIYEESDATEFSDEPRSVRANGHRISCADIVMATHNPLVGNDGLLGATLLQTKLALYSSYVVAGRVARNTVPDVLLWDTADPYHYYRLETHGDFDVVIYGGEDHKTGQVADTTERFERLEQALKTLVPDVELTHRWSGQVIETHDGIPYIGWQADHQFVGTGFSGNGLTFGTVAAMMAADGILERSNPWCDLFAVDRKKLAGVWNYLKENKDYPYYLIRDRFAGTEARSLRSVRRGHGKLVDYRDKKVAAFRNDDGKVTLLSPYCTHMGCLVVWNKAEKTWDCPCHGSRFADTGGVISGPAETPLAPIDSSQ